jgi:hypothetical protein
MQRVIERDEQETFVVKRSLREMLAVGMLLPRLQEYLSSFLSVNGMYLKAAQAKTRTPNGHAPSRSADLRD